MKKIFTLQTDLTSYSYPLAKIIISVMVILFSINRGKIFTISIKPLNIVVTIFCFLAAVASILCIYIAVPEFFYVRKNRKVKKSDIDVLPTTPFAMERLVSLVKRNDIIEFEIKSKGCVIKVGASSDCNVGNFKFFDKRFYIGKEEYLTIEEFEKELLCYATKGIVYVITIDGIKSEKW